MVKRLPALIVAACGFILYALTAYPFPDWLDSPELIGAACRLGIFHPPGSPLAVILGRLFCLEPAALLYFSALFAGCALYVLARTVQDLWRALGPRGFRLEAAVVSGLCAAFALSFGLWSQAVRTEVYTLGLFLALGALRDLVRVALSGDGKNSRRVIRAAAFCGLGLGVHPLMALCVAPGFVLLAVLKRTRGLVLAPRQMLYGSVAFLLGAAPLLLIPLMVSAPVDLRWGDPTTLTGFFNTILGMTFSHSFAPATTPVGFKTLAAVVLGLGAGLSILAALGVYFFVRKKPAAALVLISAAAVSALTLALQRSVRLDNPDVFGYALPAMAAVFLLAAGGLAVGARLLFEARPKLTWLTAALVLLVFLATVFFQDWRQRNRSGCTAGRRLSVAALEQLPENTVAIVGDFNLAFMLEYLIQVEGLRPDVRVLYLRDLDNPALRARLAKLDPQLEARLPGSGLQDLSGLHPVALDIGPHLGDDLLARLRPAGLLWLMHSGETPPEEDLLADMQAFYRGLSPPLCGEYTTDPRTADVIAWHAYWQTLAAKKLGLNSLAEFLAGVARRCSPHDRAVNAAGKS